MITCDFCCLSAEDRKWLLYENEYWLVFFADKQDYPGRCIVAARAHRESLAQLTQTEWLSLKDITDALEQLLKAELGATLLNWSCLMNDAYKAAEPQPHVHFHVRPRYSSPITVDGVSLSDDAFGHHYNNRREDKMDPADRERLYQLLKQKVGLYFKK